MTDRDTELGPLSEDERDLVRLYRAARGSAPQRRGDLVQEAVRLVLADGVERRAVDVRRAAEPLCPFPVRAEQVSIALIRLTEARTIEEVYVRRADPRVRSQRTMDVEVNGGRSLWRRPRGLAFDGVRPVGACHCIPPSPSHVGRLVAFGSIHRDGTTEYVWAYFPDREPPGTPERTWVQVGCWVEVRALDSDEPR